jgi:hypothetical protein
MSSDAERIDIALVKSCGASPAESVCAPETFPQMGSDFRGDNPCPPGRIETKSDVSVAASQGVTDLLRLLLPIPRRPAFKMTEARGRQRRGEGVTNRARAPFSKSDSLCRKFSTNAISIL